jgi:fucose 4-O-acetylase-like acetyltransferase
LHRLLRRSTYLAVSIFCFGTLAVLIDYYAEAINTVLGERRHWWLATSAVMALMFYQLGILLRRLGWLSAVKSRLWLYILAAVFLAVSLLTFNRNHALNDHPVPVVFMIGACYGNIWWFLLTSLAGIAGMLYISQVFAANRVLTYLGQITLTLMCLDGILLDFVNPGVAALLMRLHPEQNVWFFTALCLVCTILSLLVCIPANWLLERYLPFVIGRAGRPRAPSPAVTASPPIR